VMWKNGLKHAGRTIDDYVSLIDLAATFIELSGPRSNQTGMAPITGRSLTDILWSRAWGRVNPARDHVLIGKERHDVGRPHDWGYPIRAIVKNDMLYIRNYETSRWPAGNPETGYLNCDGSPTKTEVLKTRADSATGRFWELSFGKRPQEELYDLDADPDCVKNLAGEGAYRELRTQLEGQLVSELKAQNDPRMFGNGKIFDEYPYAEERFRNFYERYMNGEKLSPTWVNESDFQKQPVKRSR
jgi:N-sulfoglucosamine sulfohydrolase